MSPERSSMPKRILVVDDLASTHEYFRAIFASTANAVADGDQEFAVDYAFQGDEALRMVQESVEQGRPYRMAFVDMHLPPGWDGLETVSRLWEADPHIEIVICSGHSDYSWEQIIAQLGRPEQILVLQKPFEWYEARQLAIALSTKWQFKRETESRHGEMQHQLMERATELEERNQLLEQEIQKHRLTSRYLETSNEVRGEQARVLSILLDLSNDLAQAEDITTVINRVIRATADLTSCRRISIMLPDPDNKHLSIAGSLGLENKLVTQVPVPVEGSVAGQVFKSRNPMLVNSHAETDGNRPQYESGFYVSAPMLSRALVTSEHVVGVLNLTERQKPGPFTSGELVHLETICNMAATAIHAINARRARDEARDSIVTALATLVEYRDGCTGLHLDRVTEYSTMLVEALRESSPYGAEIDEIYLQDLRRAVPLHDIGKVAIPDHILSKPGKLTSEERQLMQRHCELGAKTIRSTIFQTQGARFLSMAADIAMYHHEWYNGKGYPTGLCGQSIPLCARIAALADVYDALTSLRPYKKPFSHEKSVAIIRDSCGTQFDPVIVQAFLSRDAQFREMSLRMADDSKEIDKLAEMMNHQPEPVPAGA